MPFVLPPHIQALLQQALEERARAPFLLREKAVPHSLTLAQKSLANWDLFYAALRFVREERGEQEGDEDYVEQILKQEMPHIAEDICAQIQSGLIKSLPDVNEKLLMRLKQHLRDISRVQLPSTSPSCAHQPSPLFTQREYKQFLAKIYSETRHKALRACAGIDEVAEGVASETGVKLYAWIERETGNGKILTTQDIITKRNWILYGTDNRPGLAKKAVAVYWAQRGRELPLEEPGETLQHPQPTIDQQLERQEEDETDCFDAQLAQIEAIKGKLTPANRQTLDAVLEYIRIKRAACSDVADFYVKLRTYTRYYVLDSAAETFLSSLYLRRWTRKRLNAVTRYLSQLSLHGPVGSHNQLAARIAAVRLVANGLPEAKPRQKAHRVTLLAVCDWYDQALHQTPRVGQTPLTLPALLVDNEVPENAFLYLRQKLHPQTCCGNILNRLVTVFPRLHENGAIELSGSSAEATQKVISLKEEAGRLWYERVQQQTLRDLCVYYNHRIAEASANGGMIDVPPVMVANTTRRETEEELEEFLLQRLPVPHVTQRLIRLMTQLEQLGIEFYSRQAAEQNGPSQGTLEQ